MTHTLAFATIALGVLLIAPAAGRAQSQRDAVLAVTGGTLIDGTGAGPVGDAVIVVRGHRIASVGTAATVSIPAGARRIDARGRFIIPGFIDAHAHLRDDWMHELFLVHGVTSVVDQGSHVAWILAQQDAIARAKIRGPRIFTSGATFRCRGASCRADDYSAERLRARVKALVGAGANLITVGQFESPESLAALTDEAHKQGVPISGETFYIREASLSGFDAIPHSYALSIGAVPDDVRAKVVKAGETDEPIEFNPLAYLVPPARDELLDRLLKNKVFVVPMLVKDMKVLHDRQAEFREENARLLSTQDLDYIPIADIAQSVLSLGYVAPPTSAGGLLRLGDADERSERYRGYKQGYRNVQAFLAQYVSRGGKVLAGTDLPNYSIPGIALHHELRLLVDAGLTPMQALQAATAWPAEFLRKDADVGTIRPGRFADMVIVDANPIEDIKHTMRISTVLKGGIAEELAYHRDYRNPIPSPPVSQAPRLTAIAPDVVTQQDAPLELTLRGRDFVPESVVTVNGIRVPTRYLSGGRLTATIPPALVEDVGTLAIRVANPPRPVSGTSDALYLIVRFR